jgi:isoleucyl-tRNA synthetase
MNQLTSGSIAYYNELAKDITYVKAEGSQERKEAQLVISELIKFVLFSLATIIPMTVEEAYKFYNPDNKGSILFEEYPEFKSYDVDFNEFKSIRDLVNKSVEELKEQQLVKRIQEVEINIQLPENLQH